MLLVFDLMDPLVVSSEVDADVFVCLFSFYRWPSTATTGFRSSILGELFRVGPLSFSLRDGRR